MLLIATAATAPALAVPWVLSGRVVNVHDGDSITILDTGQRQHKVRLDGIDAPELGQPFGRSSRSSLRDLAHGQAVDAMCHKTDRFGRQVCNVVVQGADVGRIQLERGLAWFFARYARELSTERRSAYRAAEGEARSQRAGLWSDPEPVTPWDWRKAKAAGNGTD